MRKTNGMRASFLVGLGLSLVPLQLGWSSSSSLIGEDGEDSGEGFWEVREYPMFWWEWNLLGLPGLFYVFFLFLGVCVLCRGTLHSKDPNFMNLGVGIARYLKDHTFQRSKL